MCGDDHYHSQSQYWGCNYHSSPSLLQCQAPLNVALPFVVNVPIKVLGWYSMIYRRKGVLKFGVCVSTLQCWLRLHLLFQSGSDKVMFSIETALEEGNVLAILITLILNNLPMGIKFSSTILQHYYPACILFVVITVIHTDLNILHVGKVESESRGYSVQFSQNLKQAYFLFQECLSMINLVAACQLALHTYTIHVAQLDDEALARMCASCVCNNNNECSTVTDLRCFTTASMSKTLTC